MTGQLSQLIGGLDNAIQIIWSMERKEVQDLRCLLDLVFQGSTEVTIITSTLVCCFHCHCLSQLCCAEKKTVMLMSTKISTWVLYISALCSWYCCQSHSHCHDLGPIKMRLKTKWKLFAVFLSLPCTLIKQLSWQDHLFKETKLNEHCIIFVIRGM